MLWDFSDSNPPPTPPSSPTLDDDPSPDCPGCVDKQEQIMLLEQQVKWLIGFLSATRRKQFEQTFGTGAAHTGDPWTSHFAAAMQSSEKRWARRLRVLRVLLYHQGTDRVGATDDEMCFQLVPAGLGLDPDKDPYSTFRTCRTELRNLMLVRESGVRRPSRTRGSPANVWEAVPDAMQEFERLRSLALEKGP